jgi:hypothetical protein
LHICTIPDLDLLSLFFNSYSGAIRAETPQTMAPTLVFQQFPC